ncbi:MAG: hypothetical protein LBM25_07075, partial [Bacteroidales bacterium]|nr:hypothetical protein [Bacteroidales bacterium]
EYDVNRTPNKEYSYILERTPKIKDAIGYKGTLGLELSFLLKDNLKINIASYLDIPIYNMEGYYAKITYDEPSQEYVSGIIINKSSPNLGLGFSLGVEYMFKKKL